MLIFDTATHVIFDRYFCKLLITMIVEGISRAYKYVSGWYRHGFKSNSRPFLLTYPEADSKLCFLEMHLTSHFIS